MSFSHQRILGGFHWSLSDSQSPPVSTILADLNNALVWFVSIPPLISNTFQTFGNRSKCANCNWYHQSVIKK